MLDGTLDIGSLRAPFPWFGGKSRVSAIVWTRLGDVDNYVEPFFGSGAVLLSRPANHSGITETVNDKDQFVANFWRSMQADPDAVAHYADWPVNETDLHARHYWLVTTGAERLSRVLGDPAGYDAHVAGWWVWGTCAWIGAGWCSGKGPWQWDGSSWVKPDAGNAGRGINRNLPHLGDAGRGINRNLPHLGDGRREFIRGWMTALSARLRDVRVACGDWARVCGDSIAPARRGITGVFLDPPYGDTASRCDDIYAVDDTSVAYDVRAWAVEQGSNPKLRICLAGYDGEHVMPRSWECVAWKATGGYGSQGYGAGRINADRERLWFSPSCITPTRDRTLLDLMGAA